MFQKKTVALVAAAVVSLTALSACGSGSDSSGTPQKSSAEKSKELSGENLSQHYVFYQELPDGRRVMCVWAKWGNGGGPSCDWEGLHKDDHPTPSPTS